MNATYPAEVQLNTSTHPNYVPRMILEGPDNPDPGVRRQNVPSPPGLIFMVLFLAVILAVLLLSSAIVYVFYGLFAAIVGLTPFLLIWAGRLFLWEKTKPQHHFRRFARWSVVPLMACLVAFLTANSIPLKLRFASDRKYFKTFAESMAGRCSPAEEILLQGADIGTFSFTQISLLGKDLILYESMISGEIPKIGAVVARGSGLVFSPDGANPLSLQLPSTKVVPLGNGWFAWEGYTLLRRKPSVFDLGFVPDPVEDTLEVVDCPQR
jgi:hypothetical protein